MLLSGKGSGLRDCGVAKIEKCRQPKRSSFSGKMEVAKLFLCSKLSSKSC